MINGYVVNNLGRGRHIFKQPVAPGMRIPLESLYKLYKKQYGGDFDVGFLEWLESTKIPKGCGFDIVVKSIEELQDVVAADVEDVEDVEEVEHVVNTGAKYTPHRLSGGKLTARQIADLKVKDNPKELLKEVLSVHKLRRALNYCKGRPGRETIVKLIRGRITELS